MPRLSVSTTVMVSTGARCIRRIAYERSLIMEDSIGSIETEYIRQKK